MRRGEVMHREIAKRRKSLPFFAMQSEQVREISSDWHMMSEDMCNRIMPFGRSSRSPSEYRIAIEPDSQNLDEILRMALMTEHHEHSLESTIEDLFRQALRFVLLQGEAIYEIVYDSDDSPKQFVLVVLPPGESHTFMEVLTQVIPDREAARRGLRVSGIDIEVSNIVRFTFPDSLGGKSGTLGLIEAVGELGNALSPAFVTEDRDAAHKEFGYGLLSDYHQLRELALARVTAKLGWNARSLMDKSTTEFYQFYRHLKFARSLALIREHFLKILNGAIVTPFKRIGLEGELKIMGIPTAEELDLKLNGLLDGETSFEEVLRLAYPS
ncbi:hypothetical protein [Singulisphaera sp. PoT]|uniref:hypothetical protein n=1 Tax=Singulisphaera sp. PoT TaxID=3411797 RepID=UPI003BF4CB72